MKFGVSTASLYPLETELALRELIELGVDTCEIFFNAEIELNNPIFSTIAAQIRASQMDVVSVHPFQSPFESLYLFSAYERRVAELLDLYSRYFACMQEIGAKIFVLHGAFEYAACPEARYFERFIRLAERAKSFGVTLAQENVGYCKSKSQDFLVRMCREIGTYANFVLDMKQAIRSGVDVFALIDALGTHIVHVHASDSNGVRDCMPVGAGTVDFEAFLRALASKGYDGAIIVELYREDYDEYDALYRSVCALKQIYANHLT